MAISDIKKFVAFVLVFAIILFSLFFDFGLKINTGHVMHAGAEQACVGVVCANSSGPSSAVGDCISYCFRGLVSSPTAVSQFPVLLLMILLVAILGVKKMYFAETLFRLKIFSDQFLKYLQRLKLATVVLRN